MKYWSPIDPHVHLRWTEYAGHHFLEWGLEDAAAAGLAAVMEMGNTAPQITDEATLDERCAAVEVPLAAAQARHGPLAHYVHPGLTDRPDATVALFQALRRGHPRARAAKLYTCHSTGRMGLTDPEVRRGVWQAAAGAGWEGPVVVHAQDHEMFGPPYDPADPPSHSRHQREKAEVCGAIGALEDALRAGFAGTVVLAHVSSPATVQAARDFLAVFWPPFRVALEVTWHHLFLNADDDYPLHGNRVKMNPPLSPRESQGRLLRLVLDRPQDFMLGTDHAPHPVEAKDRLDPSPASGVPAIPFWARGIQMLREMGVPEAGLRRLTFDNANEVFGLGLAGFEVDAEYDPSRWAKYGWNPFSRVG